MPKPRNLLLRSPTFDVAAVSGVPSPFSAFSIRAIDVSPTAPAINIFWKRNSAIIPGTSLATFAM